jgi:cytochrome c peroxidase
MVLKPIVNHVEMGINDLNALCDRLEAIPYYREMFTRNYGSPEITPQNIAFSLVYFLSKMQANNTRFDKARMGQPLSAEEASGRSLFTEKYNCNSCHQVESPTGYQQAGTFANIGLDKTDSDPGRGGVTRDDADMGKFRIPSLRNVVLTGPYMHDGRYKTLDEVMDHYTDKLADHRNLDPRLRNPNGGVLKQHISVTEKKAIIAFLHTLTDMSLITNPELSNPFKVREL